MQDKPDRDRSPEGRFKYLAEKRVGKVLKALESLSNLSSTKNYEYEPDEVKQIIDFLTVGLEDVKEGFERGLRASRDRPKEFKFK